MAEYQKFMFDNFVVECDEEKCIAEPLDAPNEADIDIAENIVADVSNEVVADDIIINDDADFAEEEKVIEPMFRQDELDAAVLAAEERGFVKGKDEAISESEQKKQELLSQIENKLESLLSNQDGRFAELERAAIEVAITAIDKILPTLEQGVAKKEVEAFLKDNFVKFKGESSLSFCFHPDMVAEIAPVLSKMAEKNDFEGKIAVHKDVNLGLSDCRVEWKNGGVERNLSAINDKIRNIIEQ